jgi:hypothetical protein
MRPSLIRRSSLVAPAPLDLSRVAAPADPSELAESTSARIEVDGRLNGNPEGDEAIATGTDDEASSDDGSEPAEPLTTATTSFRTATGAGGAKPKRASLFKRRSTRVGVEPVTCDEGKEKDAKYQERVDRAKAANDAQRKSRSNKTVDSRDDKNTGVFSYEHCDTAPSTRKTQLFGGRVRVQPH